MVKVENPPPNASFPEKGKHWSPKMTGHLVWPCTQKACGWLVLSTLMGIKVGVSGLKGGALQDPGFELDSCLTLKKQQKEAFCEKPTACRPCAVAWMTYDFSPIDFFPGPSGTSPVVLALEASRSLRKSGVTTESDVGTPAAEEIKFCYFNTLSFGKWAKCMIVNMFSWMQRTMALDSKTIL